MKIWIKTNGNENRFRLCKENGTLVFDSVTGETGISRAAWSTLITAIVGPDFELIDLDVEDQWVYGIWNIPVCEGRSDYVAYKDGCYQVGYSKTVEEAVSTLLTARYNPYKGRFNTGVPIFGVRRLTPQEERRYFGMKYAAFINGKRVRGSLCLTAEECVRFVQELLEFKAKRARTLDDFELAE